MLKCGSAVARERASSPMREGPKSSIHECVNARVRERAFFRTGANSRVHRQEPEVASVHVTVRLRVQSWGGSLLQPQHGTSPCSCPPHVARSACSACPGSPPNRCHPRAACATTHTREPPPPPESPGPHAAAAGSRLATPRSSVRVHPDLLRPPPRHHVSPRSAPQLPVLDWSARCGMHCCRAEAEENGEWVHVQRVAKRVDFGF